MNLKLNSKPSLLRSRLNMVANDGNMKSWLCSHFQFTKQFDSQFFILRVIASVFIINHKIKIYG